MVCVLRHLQFSVCSFAYLINIKSSALLDLAVSIQLSPNNCITSYLVCINMYTCLYNLKLYVQCYSH